MPIGIPSGLWMSIPERADCPNLVAVSARKSMGLEISGVGIDKWRDPASEVVTMGGLARSPAPLPLAETLPTETALKPGRREFSSPSSLGETEMG